MPEHDAQTLRLVQAQGGFGEPGAFAEEVARLAEGEDVPREVREALLLRPGRFNGWDFSEADLREMESAFDPDNPPPLQLDHSKSARDTYGSLRAVRFHDGWLRGLVEYSGEEAVTRFRAGHWRKLSLGIRIPGAAGRKAGARKRIEECSITPFPAVGGAEPARVLSQNGGEEMPEETATQTTENEIAETAEEKAGLTEAAQDEKAILADMEERLAKLELENQEKDRLIRLREDTDLLVRLCSEGKSVPAVREKELTFLQSLSTEQRQAWVELKDASPSYASFTRKSLPETNRPGTAGKGDVEAQVAELTAIARQKGIART